MLSKKIKNQFLIYFIGSISLLVSLTMNDVVKFYFLQSKDSNHYIFLLYSFIVIIFGTLLASYLSVYYIDYNQINDIEQSKK